MNLKTFIFLLLLFPFSYTAFAQSTYHVSGRIADANDASMLIGVTAVLTSASDQSQKLGDVTDENGFFTIDDVAPGKYVLTASYIGYQPLQLNVNVSNQDLNLGSIKLKSAATRLKDVVVKGKQIRAQQLGDTSQFNADAYKTNPDATTEDLVSKMPGVTSDNTGVKVNGESVKQVLVDGKPFFGTDPSMALKNLPAEVVDKIQVFDKLSDQAQFTGFDDGQSQKTINIVTRAGKNNGEFGKAYAGYGTDDRYIAGGNLNIFNGDQRLSIIGLSNNVNQQNFSSEDVLGISSGSQNRGGGGGGGRGGGGGGGNAANNFLVDQQGGITTTNSVGLNYSDAWGKKKKIHITGSYFFNQTDNTNSTDLTRSYFADSALLYNESSIADTKNYNHRFNVRFEYKIDSFNSLTITPNLSLQQNNYSTSLTGSQTLADQPSSYTNNSSTSNNNGYNFSNNILFQHKFHKKGRTVSLNVGTQANDKTGDGLFYALNAYAPSIASPLGDTTLLDQHYNLSSNSYTASANLTYTEPLGKKGQLMANYEPSYTKSTTDKETDDYDDTAKQYTDLNPMLSNKYENTYVTQRGGLSYRVGDRKLNFMARVSAQYATLDGTEYFPQIFSLDKSFSNILPQAMFNYRFADGRNLRIMYRTSTVAPTITQLQNVVDNSNPLLLKTGNADLKQDFENTLIVRYGLTKSKTAHSFFLFLYANYINDYIGNATYIPNTNDSIFGISVNKGSQLTRPVNLNNYASTRAFVTYGLPLDVIKSNLNLNGGFSYSHSPSLINDVTNYSDNYTVNGGFVLSSNISQNVDFTLSYSANYNIVTNTVQTASNDNYFSQVTSLKFNWIFLKGFVFNTSVSHTLYDGLGAAYNQSFFLWNAYVGYKFLKNRALEARLTAFDILKQNRSIARNATDTYIEDSRTQVLTQYFTFMLTYTLRNFKGQMNDDSKRNEERPGFPMGGFRHGGGPGGGMPQGGPEPGF